MHWRFKKLFLTLLAATALNAGLICLCAFIIHSDFAGAICSCAVAVIWLLYVVGFCRKKA